MSLSVNLKIHFRRRPGFVLAAGLALLAAYLIYLSWLSSSSNTNDFISNLYLNLGSGIIGMALTVGLIDFLLALRAESEHREACIPRILDLFFTLSRVAVIQSQYLNKPTKDDFDRYQRSLLEANSAAHDLYMLVGSKKPGIASELAGYMARTRNQVEQLHDLINDILNESIYADSEIKQVFDSVNEIQEFGNRLTSILSNEYKINPNSYHNL